MHKFWSKIENVPQSPIGVFSILSYLGVERCRKLIVLSISTSISKKLPYYQQQLFAVSALQKKLPSCTLSFLQCPFCTFCKSNFVNFFSDAESADVSAFNAEDFADVTLVKMTLLMLLWSVRMARRFEAHKVILAAKSPEFVDLFSISTCLPTISIVSAILLLKQC